MISLKTYHLNKNSLQPNQINKQLLYNTDTALTMSAWSKGTLTSKIDQPHQTSGLSFIEKGSYNKNYNYSSMVGYIHNAGNSAQYNAQFVGLYSLGFSNGHAGFPSFPSNFLRCLTLFAARRLIQTNWIIHYSEYLAPQPSQQLAQFTADAVVYSLFETKNNMTAVRDVPHKGQLYRIKNNLFWISKEYMRFLADRHQFHEMYNDIRNEKEEAYLFNVLDTEDYTVRIEDPLIIGDEPADVPLSPQANLVLELATSLVIDSMEYRSTFHEHNPQYNLQAWDAGYYQLKYLWRELFPERLDALRNAYRALEEYLQPQVYELGMLLK